MLGHAKNPTLPTLNNIEQAIPAATQSHEEKDLGLKWENNHNIRKQFHGSLGVSRFLIQFVNIFPTKKPKDIKTFLLLLLKAL